MANYLCRATNPRVPDYLVKKVSVPADKTLHAGDIVMLKELDSGIENNYQVYTGTQPATDNLKLRAAIIINDGFETLPDGRRPKGQPDYTQYVYQAGDVVTAIMLVPGLDFELSTDTFTGSFAAGTACPSGTGGWDGLCRLPPAGGKHRHAGHGSVGAYLRGRRYHALFRAGGGIPRRGAEGTLSGD